MRSSGGGIAGRLARPSWRDPRLVIGIALIAASVALVVSLVRAADRTEPYFMLARDVAPGTVLGQDDLVVGDSRLSTSVYVGAAQQPWGKVITRTLTAGELLPQTALAEPEAYSARPVALRTTRPVADSIGPGSLVDVWLTVTDAAGTPSSRLVGQSLAVEAIERDEGSFAGTGVETVYVVVPREGMEAFLDALASEGELSVVGMAG